jgi:hypothetical protein
MSTDGADGPDGGPRVHIDIDTAEELVETSSAHARGELEDAEFLERREQLLMRDPEESRGSTT